MGMTCRFCGSHRVKTVSDSGDPFQQHPERTICLDCGRLLWSETEPLTPDKDEILKKAKKGKTI